MSDDTYLEIHICGAIREAELAQGTEMGSFSVSDEVREWLTAA